LVILFDVGVLGLLVATGGDLAAVLVHGLFFLNPTSLFRLLNLVVLLEPKTMAEMGFAVHALSPWGLMIALALWGAVPLCLGVRQLRRLA
jgi:Cu-processing system permease protein